MSLIQVGKKPFTQLVKYSKTHNAITVFAGYRNQSTKTDVGKSDDAGVESKPSPYSMSPFKVPFSNKAEWAVARVDDILNAVRRVRAFIHYFLQKEFVKVIKLKQIFFIIRVHFGH